MKGEWKKRALQGAGIGIVIWWLMETFKQIGRMIIEINQY